MTKQLGPTFGNEVIAAGLAGKPFVWGNTDVSITGRQNLSQADNATLDAVIAAHDPTKKILNVIPFGVFIQRWTDVEYALLMQRRATAIGAGNVTLVKQWDTAVTNGEVNLNSAAAVTFKAALVSAAILTQARADAIFV